MTLYLKYRPQTIDELDLESVRVALEKIVKSKNLPHAFLFAGPKGTGKTSAARILAKVINCQSKSKPCNRCMQCISIMKGNNMDVIEMDAASNRGIDDIRSLRENIILSPTAAKKKIYIIDEVHMLTTEAANAFLKTLEEPPSHVVFILATTNPEKLPDTVRSRLTNIIFEKAAPDEIKRQLKRVIRGEKLEVEKGVDDLIAKVSDGSFRDAVKVLEQLALNFKKITNKKTEEFLFQTKVLKVTDLVRFLEGKDSQKALELVEKIVKEGGSIKNLSDSLLSKLHDGLLAKVGIGKSDLEKFSKEDILVLIDLFSTAKRDSQNSPIAQLPFEIAVVKWCQAKPDIALQDVKKKVEVIGAQINDDTWKKVLENVRVKNASIEALLRAAKPLGFDGKNLTVGVYYQFHKERLEVVGNKRTFVEILEQIFGTPGVNVIYQLTEKPHLSSERGEPAPDKSLTMSVDTDIIGAAKEIFGS